MHKWALRTAVLRFCGAEFCKTQHLEPKTAPGSVGGWNGSTETANGRVIVRERAVSGASLKIRSFRLADLRDGRRTEPAKRLMEFVLSQERQEPSIVAVLHVEQRKQDFVVASRLAQSLADQLPHVVAGQIP